MKQERSTGGTRRELHTPEDELSRLRMENKWLRIELENTLRRAKEAENSYATIENSRFWKITEPARSLLDKIKGIREKAEIHAEKPAAGSIYRTRYELESEPSVSIIIPSSDHAEDLRKCIESVEEKSTYANYEIIVVENNSKEDRTFEYYRDLEKKYANVRVINWTGEFNFSAINNYGVKEATGENILLLNNDTEVITPDWMQEMLRFSQRGETGAVGAMLYYGDGTIQHAGVRLDADRIATHICCGAEKEDERYVEVLGFARNVTAVTGACMMVRRDVWDLVGGLDEDFPVALNDIDMCMKIRKKGLCIVWTPYAELFHYESKSRGSDSDSVEKILRYAWDKERFMKLWQAELDEGEQYYKEAE